MYTLIQLKWPTIVLYWPDITRNPRPHRVSLSYSIAAHVNMGATKTAESAPSSDRGTVADLVLDIVSNLREYRGSVGTAELTNHERDLILAICVMSKLRSPISR